MGLRGPVITFAQRGSILPSARPRVKVLVLMINATKRGVIARNAEFQRHDHTTIAGTQVSYSFTDDLLTLLC